MGVLDLEAWRDMTNSSAYGLVSADSHVIEPRDLFETPLPSALRNRAPKLASWSEGEARMVEGAEPVPLPLAAATGSGYRDQNGSARRAAIIFDAVLPALYDPAERVKAQDADSVEAEITYPYPGRWDAMKDLDDPDLKLACVRAYNDWIAEFTAYDPDRLVGLGKIPSTSSQDGQEGLHRCIEELHLRGVIIEAWPG